MRPVKATWVLKSKQAVFVDTSSQIYQINGNILKVQSNHVGNVHVNTDMIDMVRFRQWTSSHGK